MEVIYSLKALEDISYWKKTGNKAVQKKISALIWRLIDGEAGVIRSEDDVQLESLLKMEHG